MDYLTLFCELYDKDKKNVSYLIRSCTFSIDRNHDERSFKAILYYYMVPKR